MGIAVTTETDTVIKKVLPYLVRRGYDITTDIDFEAPAKREERQSRGYVDLLINLGRSAPTFLIEAKRASKRLSEKDKKQALSYGKSHKVPFVVVTNGADIQCYNTFNGDPIRWDGKSAEKIPTKDQLKAVKAYPSASGTTKCWSDGRRFVVERITNMMALGDADDRLSSLVD